LLNIKDYGVLVDNYYHNAANPSWEGPGIVNLTLNSTTITMNSGGTGVKVYAEPTYTQAANATVSNNCSISGGAIGILADGIGASVTVTNNLTTISGNLVGIDLKMGKSRFLHR